MKLGMIAVLTVAANGLFGAEVVAPKLPSGEDIMNKHVEATGGKAAWSKLKTQVMKANLEFVGQGVKGNLTTLSTTDNNSRTVMVLEGLGEMHQGVTAGKAWSNSAMQGPRILDGAEKKQALRSARFNMLANCGEFYSELKTEGEEALDGRPSWRVLASLKDGDKSETMWFDKESGLMVKTRTVIASPMGEIPVDSLVSDYRKAGALKVPFLVEQKIGPQTIRTTVQSVEFDTEIELTRFALPAEVQALAAKK